MANVVDSFNRADQQGLGNAESGQAWGLIGGIRLDIVSNTAKCAVSSADRGVAIDSGSPNATVQATVLANVGGLIFRALALGDANNFWKLQRIGGTSWNVYKRVAGTATQVATVNTTVVGGEVMKVVCADDTITVYQDNVQIIALTGQTDLQSASLWGLLAASTTSQYDDFSVTNATTGGIPDHLEVLTQPVGSTTTNPLATQPVAAVKDAASVTVSSDTSTVTAALNVVSGSGTLSGTTSVAASSGVATFTDLVVTGVGTFTLTFTDGTLTSATSAQFTVADRPNSPYLTLGLDGKDLGADISRIDTTVALSGDRRGVTEVRPGGPGQWWSYNGVQRVQYPRTLIDSDMPTWTELQAMTQHPVSGDTALLALLSGGTLGSGGHVIILDHAVTYTGNYRGAFPLRPGGDAVPGGTNVCILISQAYWDSMVANAGTCVIAPEKLRVSGPTNMAVFESQVQLGNFMIDGATKGWRMVGLCFRPAAALTTWSHACDLGNGDAAAQTSALANIPSNLIVDRCWIDPTTTVSTLHGFELHCAYGAVIDSGASDTFYLHTTGESHVICGYNGPGPFRVVNNYINGGTQGFFIGGALSACGMPSDIEFRYNHVIHPNQYNPSHPDYNGWAGSWMKNLWEVKAAQYVLAEDNLCEQVWPGAQIGTAFLTKAESYGNGATIGYTADILIRRNLVRKAGAGFNIAGVANTDPANPPQRVFYHDNLVILGEQYYSAATNPYVNMGLQQDCGLVHNTFAKKGTVNVGIQFPNVQTQPGCMPGVFLCDNIMEGSNYGWKFDSGTGNTANDLSTISGANYTATGNAVIGMGATFPAGNYGPANEEAIVFEDVAAANYALHGTTQGAGPQVPTQLVMAVQPSNGETGIALPQQPVVDVADASGNAVAGDTSTVTASLVTVTGSGTAFGTLTKAAVDGIADFTANGLGVTAAGGGTFRWHFTDGTLTAVDSAVFTVTAPDPNPPPPAGSNNRRRKVRRLATGLSLV